MRIDLPQDFACLLTVASPERGRTQYVYVDQIIQAGGVLIRFFADSVRFFAGGAIRVESPRKCQDETDQRVRRLGIEGQIPIPRAF